MGITEIHLMGAESLMFWETALGPAISVFALNLSVRKSEVFKSSGADWLLILLAFDATAILARHEFTNFVPDPGVKIAFVSLMMGLLFATLIMWHFLVSKFEHIYDTTPVGAWQQVKKTSLFLAGWSLIVLLSAAHVSLFIYKP